MTVSHIVADLHTHTVASGHAYSTLKEMAEAAAAGGLAMLAITDHGLAMPGGPHEYYFANVALWPRQLAGVEILRGVEANIIDRDGRLDMPEYLLQHLDIVLAGFHDGTGYEKGSVEDNTRAMVNTLAHPYIDIIVHPGNPAYPVDLEKVVLAAKSYGKALEVNNNSLAFSRPGSHPRCLRLAQLARKHGVPLVLSSDAHIYTQVGQVETSWSLIRQARVDKELILNADAARLRSYLEQRHAEKNCRSPEVEVRS